MACANVVMAGTGNALHPYRSQVGVLVEYGGELLLVDVGCFVPNVLARTGLEPYEIDRVIVTHGHTDHYCGLPQLVFLKTFAQKNPRISLYTVAEAMRLLESSIRSVRGSGIVRVSYQEIMPGTVIRIGSIEVRTLKAMHSVEAVSVSVNAGDIKVVISGDTAPTDDFREEARESSLAIHEASLTSGEEGSREALWHSTVTAALRQVSVSHLGALYHLSLESEMEARKLRESSGRIVVPDDGTSFKLC